MSTLFPILQPQIYETDTSLPLFKEVKWDFNKNLPVFKNGSPVITSGREAVLVWAWKALHTPRFRHEIYTWDYGNEVESLIGKPFTEALKKSEARRYVRECVSTCPYIVDVTDAEVSFSDNVMTLSCKIETIYGEGEMNV